MPNHVTTILTITGPKSEINRFIKAVDKGEDNHFDFNGVYPMPDELKNTSAPAKIMTQAEIDKQWEEFNALPEDSWERKEGKPCGLGITRSQYDHLIASYGHADWYSWRNDKWGTKWGSYSASEWKVDGKVATVSYETAWSPATSFFLYVSQQFPQLTFKHEFADEGGGFLGWEEIEMGNITDDVELGWNTKEGIELRTKLGVFSDEEELDTETA